MLTGGLGAGKTTLTQGIGRGRRGARARSPRRPSSSPASTRRWSAGPRSCTSTPTGWVASPSSTTSTSTPRWRTRSPWSSGATAWPRTSPTTASRSPWPVRTPAAPGVQTHGARWARRPTSPPLGGGGLMLLVLAIDTSTSAITVAAALATARPAAHGPSTPRGHTEHVAPLVRDAAWPRPGPPPADVTDVVVGNGPGPFTGLRVGIVTGLGLRPRPRHPGARRLQPRRPGRDAGGRAGRRGRVPRGDRRAPQGGLLGALRVDPDRAGADRARAAHRPGGRPSRPTCPRTCGRCRPPAAGRCSTPSSSPTPVGVLDVQAAVARRRLRVQRLDAGVELPVEPLYLRRPDALTTAERAKRDATTCATCTGPTSTASSRSRRELFPDDAWSPADLVGRARRPPATRLRRRGGRRRRVARATPGSTSAVRSPT